MDIKQKTKLIKLIRLIPQEEWVEVELPYFYKHDLSDDYGDSIIYGKIEEKLQTTIHETFGRGERETYEIEKDKHSSIKNSGLLSYFDEEHQSSREEFESVKERCLLFLSEC